VSAQRRLDWFGGRVPVPTLRCAECGAVTSDLAQGWRAIRCGEIDPDDTAELFFFCPDCAEREFET
jgi:hypothetical protein